MLKRIGFLLLLLSPVAAFSADSLAITAMEWARPRHGEWLLQHPALSSAIEQLQHSPVSRLQIRYPGGDEGLLWAQELQSWLVALGLESERIERIPGSGAADRIQLKVVQ